VGCGGWWCERVGDVATNKKLPLSETKKKEKKRIRGANTNTEK
jgi:hypothetical protein